MSSNESASTRLRKNTQVSAEEGLIKNENGDVHVSIKRVPTNISPHSRVQKLDRFTTTILIGGTITIIAAITMLCFLWFADPLNLTWRKIILHGWLPRAITLSSAAIRWSIASQAAIATSMIAASILERKGTSLYHAASLSQMRHSNRGPWGILYLFFDGMSMARCSRTLLMVFTLTCTSLFSQFTSTVLLQDLRDGVVVGLGDNFSIRSGYASVVPEWSPTQPYQQIIPRSYPTFAEYSEPPIINPEIDDTGITLRGLLPIASENSRSFLYSFSGNTTVMDSRVVCSRPNFVEDSVTIEGSYYAIDDQYEMYLSGRVYPSITIPELVHNSTGAVFNCSYLPTDAQDRPEIEWILSRCWLGNEAGGLLSEFEPQHDASAQYCNGTWETQDNDQCNGARGSMKKDSESASNGVSDLRNLTLGSAVLLFNFSNVALYKTPYMNQTTTVNFTSTGNGPWLDILLPDKNTRMSATLCYDALSTLDAPITTSSHTNRTEPSWGWDVAQDEYTTDKIREQLGADRSPASLDDRGILKLETTPAELRRQAALTIFDGNIPRYYTVPFATAQIHPISWYPTNYSVSFCPKCSSYSDESSYGFDANPQQASAFIDTLRNTSSPALALQAYYTTLMRMIYYDHLPLFDYPGTQSMMFFTPTLIPKGLGGLLAVIAVTILHLILMAIITFRFLTCTSATSVGSAWQAVAQLVSEDMSGILENATTASDGQVEQRVKSDGQAKTIVGLSVVEGQDRVVMMRRRPSQ